MRNPKELPEGALKRLKEDLKQAETKAGFQSAVPLVAGFPETFCGSGGYRHYLAFQSGSQTASRIFPRRGSSPKKKRNRRP
jgi:hypothetical protein